MAPPLNSALPFALPELPDASCFAIKAGAALRHAAFICVFTFTSPSGPTLVSSPPALKVKRRAGRGRWTACDAVYVRHFRKGLIIAGEKFRLEL